MNLEESKTLQCLVNAYAGESEAQNKYTFFAKIAENEGYKQISDIFLQTANNEKEHAKLFYKELPNKILKVDGSYPIFYGNTLENLIAAAKGEKEEWNNIYNNASLIAKEEGFNKISILFKNISEIEKRHASRYEKLANLIKQNNIFYKTEKVTWLCRKCGHTHFGEKPPTNCPVCNHPTAYFQILNEKF